MFTWEGETKLTGRCYLYCQLELLVLSLELLSLRQGARVDQAGVEHRLPIPDPAKHLQTKDVLMERLLHYQDLCSHLSESASDWLVKCHLWLDLSAERNSSIRS